MGRPRIVEVNYFEFKKHLQEAADAGNRIEKTDKARWTAYVKQHKVNDVAMAHAGKVRYSKVVSVIIDGGPWIGFYVYSPEEEAVLKWVRDPD